MRNELKRKVFHFLSLAYLLAYRSLGRSASLRVLGAWIVLEGSIEALRLGSAPFNVWLMKVFGGIHRPEEAEQASGIFWTGLGAWMTILFFGTYRRLVTVALLYLAFGDAAAALAGTALGKTEFRLRGRRKTLEGSLACFAVCLVCGKTAGLGASAALVGAFAAALAESLPLPFNDNFWLPIVSGLALFYLI